MGIMGLLFPFLRSLSKRQIRLAIFQLSIIPYFVTSDNDVLCIFSKQGTSNLLKDKFIKILAKYLKKFEPGFCALIILLFLPLN